MKKAIIIIGSVVILAILLFLHQTRWALSVNEILVDIDPSYNIKSRIEYYRAYGAEETFRYSQYWEYPEIFPSDRDDDYCLIYLVLTMSNHSVLPYNIEGAFLINSQDNKSRIYEASSLIATYKLDRFQTDGKECVLTLGLYRNGRTDEEIVKDLSELEMELIYNNQVFQLKKRIDLNNLKKADKNPFDPN